MLLQNISRNNVNIAKAFIWLRHFMVFVPIMVPYYKSLGLSLTEIFISQSCFSIMVLLLEIPSGFLADKWTRKGSLSLGSLLTIAGFGIMYFANGFWGIVTAEIVLAFAYCFVSGAFDALVYDSLDNPKKEFNAIKSQVFAGSLMAMAIGSVAGGWLGEYSLKGVMLLQFILISLSAPLAFGLKEPQKRSDKNKGATLRKTRKVRSLKKWYREIAIVINLTLVRNKSLRFWILFAAISNTATLACVWMGQNALQNWGMPIQHIGWFWASLLIVAAMGAKVSPWISRQNRMGDVEMSLAIPFVLSISILWVGLFYNMKALPVFVIIWFVRGVIHPWMSHKINTLAHSKYRSTILSLDSMFSRLLFSVVGPLLGLASDSGSAAGAFVYLAGGVWVLMGALLLNQFLSLKKESKKSPKPSQY